MSSIVGVEDIQFRFAQGDAIIEGFSMTLDAGERVVITGPNGAGKTTFLHILLGFLRPERGRIAVLGQERNTPADFVEVRRLLGMVFQDSHDQVFCPTVWEDVAFGPANLGLQGETLDARVNEVLTRLDLERLRDTPTHHLSHGQRRMVALAGVLAMEPRALLLDEPTAGLDAKAEARLLDVLLGLPQEMIVVSHNEVFIDAIGTRRIEMGVSSIPQD